MKTLNIYTLCTKMYRKRCINVATIFGRVKNKVRNHQGNIQGKIKSILVLLEIWC